MNALFRILSRYHFAAIVFGWGMLLCGTSFANEWKWSFHEGDQFDVALNHSTDSKTSFGEQMIQQKYSYQLETTWKVKQVDESQLATIEKGIRSIRFQINSDSPVPFNIDVDTATGKASGKTISGTEGLTILKHLQTLVGKTLMMTMEPNGATQALPLPADTKAAIDAFPKSDYTLQMFDIKGIGESETSNFVKLPAAKHQAGTNWVRESDPDVHLNESFVTTFTYVGEKKENGVVLDEFGITVTPKKAGDRKVAPGSPEPATVSEQTGSGSCFFDREEQHFTSSSYRSKVAMSTSAGQTVVTSEFSTNIVRK